MKKTLSMIMLLMMAVSVSAEPVKALLITGGCCHDYGNQRDIIPDAINSYSSQKVDWTILHSLSTDGTTMLDLYQNPDWAKGFDIVVHNECFAKVGDPTFIGNIVKAHEDVPAVLIHCTMHCYRTGPTKEEWFKFCGVHSPGHGPKHPFEVQITNPEHEVMKGMSNWTTPNGELYFIAKTYPTTTPLAQSFSEKKQEMHTNIWVNEYGPNKTRVFATSIGHHNETMMQEQYREMITRGFLWAAGKPVAEYLNK